MKIICAEREKYKEEKKNCHIWKDLFPYVLRAPVLCDSIR